MRFLFLLIIKLYWFFAPKSLRKRCLFQNSCSHYVYDETKNKGFYAGIKALRTRINQCKPGYDLIFENSKFCGLKLTDGSFLPKDQISDNLLHSDSLKFFD